MRQHVYTLITAALDPTIGYVRMLDTFGNRTVEIFVWEAADELTAAIQGAGIPEGTTLDTYVSKYVDNILMLFTITSRLPSTAKLDQLAHDALIEGCFPTSLPEAA